MKNILVIVLVVALLVSLNSKDRSDKPNDSIAEVKKENATSKTITKVPFIHKVVKGEGLWQIAAKELGSGEKWGELAEANGIKKPYIIYAGQEIKIPGKETELVNEQVTQNTYTLEQIVTHSNKDDCWFAIEGKVYDVTPFVKSGFHPGRDAILEGCGKDATELFNTRPMGSKTTHSERARKSLQKYLIGNLEG